MSTYRIITFYKFVKINDCLDLQKRLREKCLANKIKGTILLAKEGINATISGEIAQLENILRFLAEDGRFEDLPVKESFADFQPFYRLKIALKKEIVTLGVQGIDPTTEVGMYVEPKDWNDLLNDPNVVLIDTRNDYEVGIGTFKGAIDPKIKTFREFPNFIEKNQDKLMGKKIVTFCTGGIRCEKATAYLLKTGLENVYHLKGGILKYLEEIPETESLWEGQCFVFDNRVAVDHKLAAGEYDQCHACRHPVSNEEKASPKFQQGISCPYCFDTLPEKTRHRAIEREKQCQIAASRHQRHVGAVMPSSPIDESRP